MNIQEDGHQRGELLRHPEVGETHVEEGSQYYPSLEINKKLSE